MGTNYYWIKDQCPTCGHRERLHIGKSSCGWKFAFHGTPETRMYQDWVEKLNSGGTIKNEYGKKVSVGDFLEMVELKQREPNSNNIDLDGYDFSFYEFC